MEREESTLQALLNYLLEHGYPEESLAVEYPIGGKYRADAAVVDPASKLPIAVFELKRQKNQRSRSIGRTQLRRYLHALGTESVQAYLVWTIEEPPFFELEYYTSSEDEGVTNAQARIEDVPFEVQRQSTRSGIVGEKRKKESSWRRGLMITSGIMAAILLVFLGLELGSVIELGTSALLLLAGACVAILLPFYDRVKFYGIELQRLLATAEKKEKDS